MHRSLPGYCCFPQCGWWRGHAPSSHAPCMDLIASKCGISAVPALLQTDLIIMRSVPLSCQLHQAVLVTDPSPTSQWAGVAAAPYLPKMRHCDSPDIQQLTLFQCSTALLLCSKHSCGVGPYHNSTAAVPLRVVVAS